MSFPKMMHLVICAVISQLLMVKSVTLKCNYWCYSINMLCLSVSLSYHYCITY